MVSSVNQVSYHWNAHVLPFPTTSQSLQSVTFERRCDSVNAYSLTIFQFKVNHVNGVSIMIIVLQQNNDRIAYCLISHMYGSNGGLTYKPLSQINKVSLWSKSKPSLWNTDEWKPVLEITIRILTLTKSAEWSKWFVITKLLISIWK